MGFRARKSNWGSCSVLCAVGGRKRPTKGAAAAGKFEEKADFRRTKSKRDVEVESNRIDLISRLGLEDYEDDLKSGSDLRKTRKDAARLHRKKETKKAKLAEKKRMKGLSVLHDDDDPSLSWQERAVQIWDDLCCRSSFLLPEEMGNRLVIEDEKDNHNDGEGYDDLSSWTDAYVLSPLGYLDILRTYSAGGKVLPRVRGGEGEGEGEGEEEEEESFFLFALAAWYASLDGFPPILARRALDLPSYLLRDAWSTGDIVWKYDRLKSALGNWTSSGKGSDGRSVEGVSSRLVHVSADMSGRDEEGQSVSMHDALAAGLLTAALGALEGREKSSKREEHEENGNKCRIIECTSLLKALLQRQADAFSRVHTRVMQQRGESKSRIASTVVLVKLAKTMVSTSICIDACKPPTSLLNLANERAQRFDGAYTTARRICIVCGVYTDKVTRSKCDGSVSAVLGECDGLWRSGALRVPVSPFLDEYGRLLASHPSLNKEDHRAIVGAIVNRLAQAVTLGEENVDTLGCCRLLAGFVGMRPGANVEKLLHRSSLLEWRSLVYDRVDGGMLSRALQMSSQEFIEEITQRAAA